MSLKSDLLRLAADRSPGDPLRREILATLQRTARRKITVNPSGMSIRDIEGSAPWGEDVGTAIYLKDSGNGVQVKRAVGAIMREHQRDLERLHSGDEVVGFIENKVYEQLGKHVQWSYIQLPM